MSADPLDEPESEGMALLVPFVACQSQGGPYEDAAFAAGFEAGKIWAELEVAHAINADSAMRTVHSTLIRQYDLIAMHHGFHHLLVAEVEDMPEWSFVTFSTAPPEEDS